MEIPQNLEGRTIEIVAEAHESACYAVAAYWLKYTIMPPRTLEPSIPSFDGIELSGHVPLLGNQRNYTGDQVQSCIESCELVIQTEGSGRSGGLIWKFSKSFEGRTLQIVAEVHKKTCYAITGYWLNCSIHAFVRRNRAFWPHIHAEQPANLH